MNRSVWISSLISWNRIAPAATLAVRRTGNGKSGDSQQEVFLPVKISGKEQSFLELLEQMKQNGALRSRYTKKVDIPGTIRKAVEHGKTELPLCIAAEDLCEKELTKKRVYRLLFVVDVSRSVGAKERLAFAKGAVMSLLGQAYRKRDKVGMVVFGDGQAQLILPFTKSVDLAAERLRELKAKGNSPVGMGIREALKVVRAEKRKHPQDPCLLILLTDGKCNYDVQEGKPMEQAKKAARQISREQIPALVIDCDRSVFGMGLAKELAKEAQALCVDLN